MKQGHPGRAAWTSNPTEERSSACDHRSLPQHLREKVSRNLPDPGVSGPQAVEQSEDFTEPRPILHRLRCSRVQRLDGLPPNSPAGVRPDGRRIVARGPDRARHRLSRPCRRHSRRQRPEPSRSNKAQRVKRELFEMREMDLAAVRRIQIRALRSLQRPLYDRMRNTETLGKRPVTPIPIVGEQPAEDIS